MSQDDSQKLQDDWVFTVNDVLNSIPNKYEFEQLPQVVHEKVAEPEVLYNQVYKRSKKNGKPVPKPTMTTEQPGNLLPKQPTAVLVRNQQATDVGVSIPHVRLNQFKQ